MKYLYALLGQQKLNPSQSVEQREFLSITFFLSLFVWILI